MKSENKLASLGLLTAISASLCCIAPLLALVAGTSGMASNFAWLEPFRPYLIGFTILVLAFAWYKKLQPAKTDNCNCATETKTRFIDGKPFLGIVTVFSLAMLAFPYFSNAFYKKAEKKQAAPVTNIATVQTAEFKIEGMSCESCEHHISEVLSKEAGILNAKVSYENSNAIVEFDNTKIDKQKIEQAINSTGYTVANKK